MSEDSSLLTDIHRKRFEEHINSKATLIGKCPICSARKWQLMDSFIRLSLYHAAGGMRIGGSVYPNVGMFCMNCGNTHLFNAYICGVLRHGEDAPPSSGSEVQDG